MATGYPIPKFRFTVAWSKPELSNATEVGFTEVSGLDYQIDLIEYRTGIDIGLSKIKLPGMRKFSNVTLKKGLVQGMKDANSDFYKWIDGSGSGTPTPGSIRSRKEYRKTLTITLIDEESQPVIAWTLQNAFPVKVAFSDMKADANEISIDTLELAHEGLTMEYK
jgi:phage tail-like protein